MSEPTTSGEDAAGRPAGRFDPQPLLEAVGNDWPAFVSLVVMFQETSVGNVERLKSAVHASDLKAINHEAHALKGSVALLRGEPARSIAERIELGARAPGQEDLVQLFAEFQAEFALLRADLQAFVCAAPPVAAG